MEENADEKHWGGDKNCRDAQNDVNMPRKTSGNHFGKQLLKS